MAVCFYDAAAGPTAANTSSELHKLQLSDLSRYPESLLAQAASRRSAKEQQEGIAVQQYADYLPFVMNIYRCVAAVIDDSCEGNIQTACWVWASHIMPTLAWSLRKALESESWLVMQQLSLLVCVCLAHSWLLLRKLMWSCACRTGQLQLPDIWELETNRNQWFAELALALDYFQLPTIYELVKQQPRYRLPGLQQYFAHKLAADVAKQVLALLPKGLHTMRTLTDRGRGYCLPTEVA